MSTRRVESFLLRIVVAEGHSPAPERWRGRIQHIASGAEQQIDELAEMVAFISTHLQPLGTTKLAIEVVAEPALPAQRD